MAERLRPKSQELTPAELEIMQILWARGKGFVNDVIEHLPEPKPAYNTVSTVLRVLEKKGFVGYKAYGKSHEYYPLVDRDSYTSTFMSSVLDRFFGGSTSRMVSFLTSSKAISLEETSEIIEMLQSPEKDSVAAE
ncbi:MAG: BlaI/MecI/CopY family transcriptional regulator [Rikenellaceae bacterium]|nr:BlaI/MecI/CopY family transcriptional regulator [Rikenellaceae bacterium]